MNAFAYIWKGVKCHIWLLNILYTELDKKQGIEKFMMSSLFCAWKKLKMYNLFAKSNSYMNMYPLNFHYCKNSGFYHPVYCRWDFSFVKFRYSEKGNFFWKNLTMVFTLHIVKHLWNFISNFVAFSEYLNQNKVRWCNIENDCRIETTRDYETRS